jgi:hypothetical protein
MEHSFINDNLSRLRYYKEIGDEVIQRLSLEQLAYRQNPGINSIALLIKHLHGNMRSKWTGFPGEDGEKTWRQRDREFEESTLTKKQLTELWNAGWEVTFDAIKSLDISQLLDTTQIRKEPIPIHSAITRQLAHYAYHVGQMVYQAKIMLGENWQSLSIPIGKSEEYLQMMREKHEQE